MIAFFKGGSLSISGVKEVLYLMKGSQKHINIIKVIPKMLHFITLHDIPKETLDCYLEVFTVAYLKSEEVFKRAVLLDLQQFVDMLHANMQSFFVDRSFKCNFVLFRVFQLVNCVKDEYECPVKILKSSDSEK